MGKRKRNRSRESLKRCSRRDLERELRYLRKKLEKENGGYVRVASNTPSPRSRTRQSPYSRRPTRFRSQSRSRFRSRSPINKLRTRSPNTLRSRSPNKLRSRSPNKLRSRSPNKLRSRSSNILRSRSSRNYSNRSRSRSASRSTNSRDTSRGPRLHSESQSSPLPSTSKYESSPHNTSESEIESLSYQTDIVSDNNKRNQGSPLDSEAVVLTVERDILEALGETQNNTTDSFELYSLVQKRWEAVLSSGLTKEEKEPLISKYNPPSNLDKLKAPELNAEIKSAITINHQKTDKYVQNNQNHLGTGLSALGRALNMLLLNSDDLEKKEFQNELLKALSDAGKIFCNVYYNMSICRRSLILPLLHVKVKEITASAPLNKFLFGDNLSDLLKTAKAIERSGEDLKNHRAVFKKPIEARSINRTSHLNFQSQSKLRGGLRQGRHQPQKKGARMSLRGNYPSSQRKNQ